MPNKLCKWSYWTFKFPYVVSLSMARDFRWSGRFYSSYVCSSLENAFWEMIIKVGHICGIKVARFYGLRTNKLLITLHRRVQRVAMYGERMRSVGLVLSYEVWRINILINWSTDDWSVDYRGSLTIKVKTEHGNTHFRFVRRLLTECRSTLCVVVRQRILWIIVNSMGAEGCD